jgi:hypothetical protein
MTNYFAALRFQSLPVVTSALGEPLLTGGETSPILVAVVNETAGDNSSSRFMLVRFGGAISTVTKRFEPRPPRDRQGPFLFSLAAGEEQKALDGFVSVGLGLSLKMYATSPKRFLQLCDFSAPFPSGHTTPSTARNASGLVEHGTEITLNDGIVFQLSTVAADDSLERPLLFHLVNHNAALALDDGALKVKLRTDGLEDDRCLFGFYHTGRRDATSGDVLVEIRAGAKQTEIVSASTSLHVVSSRVALNKQRDTPARINIGDNWLPFGSSLLIDSVSSLVSGTRYHLVTSSGKVLQQDGSTGKFDNDGVAVFTLSPESSQGELTPLGHTQPLFEGTKARVEDSVNGLTLRRENGQVVSSHRFRYHDSAHWFALNADSEVALRREPGNQENTRAHKDDNNNYDDSVWSDQMATSALFIVFALVVAIGLMFIHRYQPVSLGKNQTYSSHDGGESNRQYR